MFNKLNHNHSAKRCAVLDVRFALILHAISSDRISRHLSRPYLLSFILILKDMLEIKVSAVHTER